MNLLPKVFLVVFACLKPDYTECQIMDVLPVPTAELCEVSRPAAVSIAQIMLIDAGYDNSLTFSDCRFVEFVVPYGEK